MAMLNNQMVDAIRMHSPSLFAEGKRHAELGHGSAHSATWPPLWIQETS